MASNTSKGTRIAIWIIAIVMAIGSVGAYFLIILENDQRAERQAEQQRILQQLQDEQAQVKNDPLPGYEVTPFEAADISELKVETLKEGGGETVAKGDTVKVNYFGWTPDGTIFDSTLSSLNQSDDPEPREFELSDGVIEGWIDGLDGVNVGSVHKLSIPSDLAYGTRGSPPTIGPDTPLMFIIEVVSVKE